MAWDAYQILSPKEAGSSGVTVGRPALQDPSDATKIATADKLGSLSTKPVGIVKAQEIDYEGNTKYVVQVTEIVEVTGSALTAGTGVWAVAGGTGFTQTDPGSGTSDDDYLGVAVSPYAVLLDLPGARSVGASGDYEITSQRIFGDWTALTPTFSAGDASSMPAGATATAYVDEEDSGASCIQVEATYTESASADGDATLSFYPDADGTNYSNIATQNPSQTKLGAAGTQYFMWPYCEANRFKVVLTNGDSSEAITSVSMRYRIVRG